jgi:ferredoxin hydrogenase small subunit
MSLLCADTPDLMAMLADAGIHFLWHPSLSEASGEEAIELLQACARGDLALDVLCVEGSMLRGPKGTGRFHMLAGTGRPMIDWVRDLAARATHTVAVGTCAAYGGVTSAGFNAVDACGLQYDGEVSGGLLGTAYRSISGLPVINVAGCPTHPDWVIETLLALAMDEMNLEALDALGRPRFYADHLVHHGCARNEFYEFKASAEKPSDMGCMMEHMGCKGTQAHADCNLRAWNGSGSCTGGGYPCISCTEPGFEEPGHPFAETPKVSGIPIGLPTDMPKAWFVALAALSKSATPKRVRVNATSDHARIVPANRKTGLK